MITCVPPPAGFAPGRMNKSGSYAAPGTAFTKVTGWSGDAAYPSTSIVSDELVVAKSGTDKRITAVCVWSTNYVVAGFTASMRLMKNGAQVGTTQSSTALSGTFTVDLTGQAITAADAFRMEVLWNATNATYWLTVQAAGTYIRVE